ncbi:hypothetical protein PRUB_a2007 [Pseudoalteromonas rubra]|uniref:Uncharacterized protein n=1 Tax=Pseudoalteromonas rubra TaxID=43658 RepID=A0A8T0CDW3_9GAMM|nr:hypothetical protein PRUB_a2007 [Pseudoalteromonas rubra]
MGKHCIAHQNVSIKKHGFPSHHARRKVILTIFSRGVSRFTLSLPGLI